MKKFWMTCVVVCLCGLMCFSSFASDGALSLDELQQQATETQAVIETQGEVVIPDSRKEDNTGKSSLSHISEMASMDTESETARNIGNILSIWGAKLMQILGYIISIGLGIMTALDICYMSIPPLRVTLANGYVGTSGGGAGMSGGMVGGGMKPNYGPGQASLGAQVQMQTNNQPALGRMQWVSNAALNAVSAASDPSQQGGKNMYKVYFKQQLSVCIIAPVLFVLSATGALTRFGFMLGEAITTWISNISF